MSVQGLKRSEEPLLQVIGTSVSSLYATILICVYVTFAFTDIVTYPRLNAYLERRGFFVYLYLVSCLYMLSVFGQVILAKFSTRTSYLYENEKSHGSLPIRLGSILFGVGAFVFFLMTVVSDAKSRTSSACFSYTKVASNVLLLVFIVLQMALIFFFPRINLVSFRTFNRFGTMHQVATNIILWIKILIQESLEEVIEYGELVADQRLEKEPTFTTTLRPDSYPCSVMSVLIQNVEEFVHECKNGKDGRLSKAILASSPYLFPFIIEFTLIGACVVYLMFQHIGVQPDDETALSNRVRKPNVKEFLRKSDFSHCLKGIAAGLVVVILVVLNLALFFGFGGHVMKQYETGLMSTIINIIINTFALTSLFIGFVHIRHLSWKETNTTTLLPSNALDLLLLRFSSFFSFLYFMFTIITGLFNTDFSLLSNSVHISNGSLEIVQITLQILFIYVLKQKSMPSDLGCERPGRQIVIFLGLFNLAQWVLLTFEIQKAHYSVIEVHFYGIAFWVLIQRITLPLAIFFRFHSALVLIDIFKDVYKSD